MASLSEEDAKLLAQVSLVRKAAGVNPGSASPTGQDPGTAADATRGALQGVTLGWYGKKLGGMARALTDSGYLGDKLYEALHPDANVTPGFGQRVATETAAIRQANKDAEARSPLAYGVGNVAGTVALDTALLAATGGTASPWLMAGGQGAVAGAGYSDADTLGGTARDAGIWGVLGLGGVGLGKALGKAGSWLANKTAAPKLAAAAQAAKDIETKKVEEAIRSQAGKVGAEVQKGSRYGENIGRLESVADPAQAERIATLKGSGGLDELGREVLGSTLDRAPTQVGTIRAEQAALDALQAGRDQAIAKGTARRLSEDEARAQVKARIARYANPVIGNAVGQIAGGTAGYVASDLMGLDHDSAKIASTAAGASLGGMTGGFIGSRVRAGESFRKMWENPAVQTAFYSRVKNALEVDPASFGKWAGVFTRADTPAKAAVAHFLLYNSDSEYRQGPGSALMGGGEGQK